MLGNKGTNKEKEQDDRTVETGNRTENKEQKTGSKEQGARNREQIDQLQLEARAGPITC